MRVNFPTDHTGTGTVAFGAESNETDFTGALAAEEGAEAGADWRSTVEKFEEPSALIAQRTAGSIKVISAILAASGWLVASIPRMLNDENFAKSSACVPSTATNLATFASP